ncbi:MAG: chemotaxis protein CheW [Planctomycetaceae bacterium]
MQLITFTVAGQQFAIEARRVIEVLPLIPARPVPMLPDYVTGMFVYRGRLVPLVDLGIRLGGTAAERRLSTRIVVVEYATPAEPNPPAAIPAPTRVGLVAENVIATCRSEDAEADYPPLRFEDAPFMGRILRLRGQTVHLLAVDRLLPAEVVTGLFPLSAERCLP